MSSLAALARATCASDLQAALRDVLSHARRLPSSGRSSKAAAQEDAGWLSAVAKALPARLDDDLLREGALLLNDYVELADAVFSQLYAGGTAAASAAGKQQG